MQPYQEKDEAEGDVTNRSPEELFPVLPWNADSRLFVWHVTATWPENPPSKWDHPDSDWEAFGRFFQALSWQEGDSLQISYAELAVLFVVRGYKCHVMIDEHCTFRQLIRWLQGRISFCRRKLDFPFHPGCHVLVGENNALWSNPRSCTFLFELRVTAAHCHNPKSFGTVSFNVKFSL